MSTLPVIAAPVEAPLRYREDFAAFTETLAKRNGAGPFAAGPIVQGDWDNTGVGRGLEDFTKRVEQLGVMAMPVEFSLENKSRIYTLFKLLAEQGRIKIPYVKECDKQLSMLRFQRTPRGYMKVHHENEKDRDDYPDAIAGFSSLIIQPENLPISATII